MSLVGTLAKVAVAVAAAKGIGHVIGRVTQAKSTNVTGPQAKAGGGLGSILEQLANAAGSSGSGATASAPGPGLDALIRGSATATQGTVGAAPGEGSFADVLNQSFQKRGEPKISPTPQQDAIAGLMLSAMLQAAKCDGRIDAGEKEKIQAALGDATREELAFVNQALSSPVDIEALAKQVPKGLENQIYAVSVLGIDLDSQKEAEYLGALGSALGMGPREANAIHAKLGVPPLFS
jgi:uncharacterized membrane protein YebE (DUF533 family)